MLLRLFGLMALALVVISLLHLHMRWVQCWVASNRLDVVCQGSHGVRVPAGWTSALLLWRNMTFLLQGVPGGDCNEQESGHDRHLRPGLRGG